jgi:hypothetical protein
MILSTGNSVKFNLTSATSISSHSELNSFITSWSNTYKFVKFSGLKGRYKNTGYMIFFGDAYQTVNSAVPYIDMRTSKKYVSNAQSATYFNNYKGADDTDCAQAKGDVYALYIGGNKTYATSCIAREFSNYYRTDIQTKRIEDCVLYDNILICGFDNMTARKNAFTMWKYRINHLCPADKEKSLFIDGRLDAEDLQIFCITGDNEHLMDKYEKEYLYNDSDVEEAPCSFKQTSYLAAMIGSLITNLVVNFVSNTVVEFSKVLPFKTSFNTSILKLVVED